MPLSLTVGLEFEAHRVMGVDPGDAEYNSALRDAKVATVLCELELERFFPDESCATSHLCMIQKRQKDGQYRNFLAVTFDDVAEKNRLEFGSVGAGILPAREFLSQENLSNIREAVEIFPEAVRSAASHPTGTIENDNFRFIVPDYARRFFREDGRVRLAEDRPLARASGSIHVTHTFDIMQEARSARFLSECRAHKDSLLKMPTHVIGTSFNNSSRTTYGPNTKTPTELLDICEREDYLYPMSNTVKGIINDVVVYDQVNRVIQTKITTADSEGQREFLASAQAKLLRTQAFVMDRSQEATETGERKGLLSSKMGDVYVFESYECNLQPPFIKNTVLVEHRSSDDPIVQAISNVVKKGMTYESQRKEVNEAIRILEIIEPDSQMASNQRSTIQASPRTETKPNASRTIASVTAAASDDVNVHSISSAIREVSELPRTEAVARAPRFEDAVASSQMPKSALQRMVGDMRAGFESSRKMSLASVSRSSQSISLPSKEEREAKLAADTKKHVDRIAASRRK